jgi:hypothetical protein
VVDHCRTIRRSPFRGGMTPLRQLS